MAVDRAGIALEGSLEGSCEGRVGAGVTGMEIGNGTAVLVSSGGGGGGGGAPVCIGPETGGRPKSTGLRTFVVLESSP